jgi:hypothetical protein
MFYSNIELMRFPDWSIYSKLSKDANLLNVSRMNEIDWPQQLHPDRGHLTGLAEDTDVWHHQTEDTGVSQQNLIQ